MKVLLLILLATLAVSQSITVNSGCKQYANDSSTCVVCSQRFYKDSKGLCQPVSTLCNGYDSSTGACTSCYDGYILLEVICIANSNPKDPNCANYSNGICNKCSRGYYLLNSTCTAVDPLCKTFNYTSLLCTECYQGFSNVNNTCVVQPASPTLSGCASYNNSVCIKCSRNYYMNQGVCTQVNTNCKSFNQTNGNCLSCFDGWALTNGSCFVEQTKAADPNCAKFDNKKCVNCSLGFYFNKDNVCTQIDAFCKTFNFQTLSCVACFSGFSLVNGSCNFNPDKPLYDVNCKTFDNNGKCLNCSKGFYFNANGICTQLDPNCKTYDLKTYVCNDCYAGYNLTNGSCARENVNTTLQGNCAQWLDGVCTKCVDRAYYDINNDCVMASDLCKTFNSFNGYCTSCYSGFALNLTTGVCSPSSSAACAQTDSKNVCTKCIKGYYLDASSQCQAIDPQCQTFNLTTFKCDLCYKGYSLNSANACILAPIITSTIPNCVSYDTTGQTCITCYELYYLSNNQCQEANPLCKTFDKTNGNCLSCYSTFALSKGQCVPS